MKYLLKYLWGTREREGGGVGWSGDILGSKNYSVCINLEMKLLKTEIVNLKIEFS